MGFLNRFKEILNSFKRSSKIGQLIALLAAAVLGLLLIIAFFRGAPKDVSAAQFAQFALSGEVVLDDGWLVANTPSGRVRVLYDLIEPKSLNVVIKKASDFSWIWDIFIILLALGVGVLILMRVKKSSADRQNPVATQINKMSSSFVPVLSNTSFSDVAGIDDIKGELCEIVEFLKNPSSVAEAGIIMPKGVLLIGPPGVGKTLVAKAVAGEANVPFFYESGASFVQIYVGVGAKRVRELFAAAKSQAPAIIFIDEIDAVGKARASGRSDEREATLNELLTQMDGFVASSGVVVIAATNKVEVMDEALLRSGRFDRRLLMSLPDVSGREAILRAHLKNKECEVATEILAQSTAGFSGAALATLINEAAIMAWRDGRKTITAKDFEAVRSKVLYGKAQAIGLSPKERAAVAVYQASKAVLAAKLNIEFDKISLLDGEFMPADGAIISRSEMFAKLIVLAAGTAGTRAILNEEFSIAASDTLKAKNIANRWAGWGFDNDGAEVLNRAAADAKALVGANKPAIELVANALLKSESVSKAQIKEAQNI